MPSIPLNKDADVCKEIQQASHYGQHSSIRHHLNKNGTFQKCLTDIFVDKLLTH